MINELEPSYVVSALVKLTKLYPVYIAAYIFPRSS